MEDFVLSKVTVVKELGFIMNFYLLHKEEGHAKSLTITLQIFNLINGWGFNLTNISQILISRDMDQDSVRI